MAVFALDFSWIFCFLFFFCTWRIFDWRCRRDKKNALCQHFSSFDLLFVTGFEVPGYCNSDIKYSVNCLLIAYKSKGPWFFKFVPVKSDLPWSPFTRSFPRFILLCLPDFCHFLLQSGVKSLSVKRQDCKCQAAAAILFLDEFLCLIC